MLAVLLAQVVAHLGLPTSLLEELSAVTVKKPGGLLMLSGQKRQAEDMEHEPPIAPAMRIRQVGHAHIIYSLEQCSVFIP